MARDVGVVIAAAGAGERFGKAKAFLELGGWPLVLHSLRAFAGLSEVLEIAVAVLRADLGRGREALESYRGELRMPPGVTPPRISLVEGGPRRQDSVERGFAALTGGVRWVLVHDAARPLIQPGDIEKVIAGVREAGAAALGHPATDSLKEEEGGLIARDLPRRRVWMVQTPQGASVDLLRRAFDEAKRSSREATDEAGLLSAIGVPVRLVEGKRTNIKITFPADLALAEILLKAKVP